MPSRRARTGLALAACAALLSACMVLPRTTSTYDADCGLERREMVLEMYQVGGFVGCSNDGCAALLVAAGAVTVATAVVSGSIAVVGNVVYWLERQGQCRRP